MPGLDSYTKLLLHCNGADGSTTFTDSSASAHSMTPNDNAQIDTAQYVFGGASGLFDGTNDYLTTGNHSDYDLGSGDFTIDFRVRRNGSQADFAGLLGASNTSTVGWEFDWGYNGGGSKHKVRFMSSYGGWGSKIVSSVTISDLTWTHVALVRYGNTLTMYFDGSSVGTLDVTGYTFNSGSQGLSVAKLRMGLSGYNHNGWLDEIRISKGIARWTSDFTPPSEEYRPDDQVLTFNDTLGISDSFVLQTNPDNQNIDDSINIADEWGLQVNPDNQSIDDSVSLAENWDIHISNEELTVNDICNLSDGWSVLINPETQIISENVSLSDNWVINAFGTYYSKMITDFRWLQTVTKNISVWFSWLIAKSINTDFRWLGNIKKYITTDFRWLKTSYVDLTNDLINYSDIQIKINGVDLALGNDINLQTGQITHTQGSTSVASFVLARKHDDLDRTHDGSSSQITNQNSVQIYIDGHLEFDGYVQTIDVDSENETVEVTAKMDEPLNNRQTIEIPLSSVNEQLHPYHCLINTVNIDNPKEDTRAVVISQDGKYWNGSVWVFQIEDASVFDSDILAQAYIDAYTDTTVNLIFDSKFPSVTSRQLNPQYYKGIKVNLGTKIQQQTDKWRMLETIISGKGVNATKIENGTFITRPNYTYFWAVMAKNILTGIYNGDYRYIGTSLGSTTTDLWVLNGVVPLYQKIKENIETELGYYYVGSAPYKEIATKNGRLIPAAKWQDKNDGLYNVLDASYNYEPYAKLIADLEYEKLKNINGNILPITSSVVTVMLDAYYYYRIKLLSRINITNTTVANTYNHLNGFPVAVKSITINLSTMKVSLNCDNKLSQDELDAIDEQMPDDSSDLYITPEKSSRVYRKFDLKSWMYVS